MSLTTTLSPWLAPLCLLLGIALAWWLYRKDPARDPWPWKLSILLAACRALAVAFIAFFLLEPMVRILLREVRRPVVVVLHDGSSSLLAAHAGDRPTTYAAELRKLEQRLADRYDVRAFTYGASLADGLSYEQQGPQTDIDQALREAYDRIGGADLGAVIIDGDGIYNRGRDPRSAADALGVPVFTIALGDTTVRPDLLVRNVEHNKIGYLGNELPILVRVEGRRLHGVATRISILLSGKEVAGKDVVLNGRSAFIEVPFTIMPERAGMQRYSAVVRQVTGEATEANNRMDVLIDVLDDRQKVLLFGAAPHPDLGAMRQALDGLEGYGHELAFADGPAVDPAGYDLVVLHGLPSSRFPIQAFLQKADAARVPICYIIGPGTDLSAFNARSAGLQVSAARGSATDAQARINPAFTHFNLEPELVRAIERFPPLQVPFGQFDAGRSAVILAYQRIGAVATHYPLISFVQQEERRDAVICGEGIWRWRMNDLQQNGDHARLDRLIHKLVQFLALKVNKERFRVEHAPRFADNEPVVFSAELYNATFEPVTTAEINIVLKDATGRDYPYSFSPSGNGYRAEAGRLPAGTYKWNARTALDGTAYTAQGEVYVEELVAERLTTVADHALWRDIAVRTGGIMVQPDAILTIADELGERKDLVSRSYAHPAFSDLIGIRWLFVVIVALLAVEWVIRRRSGAY